MLLAAYIVFDRPQRRFDFIQPVDALVKRTSRGQETRAGQTQNRVTADPIRRKLIYPLLHYGDFATDHFGIEITIYNLSQEFTVLACVSMTKGRVRQVVVQIPAGSTAVQYGDLLRLETLQSFTQKITEEMMIAEPLTTVIQRDQEEVLPFEVF